MHDSPLPPAAAAAFDAYEEEHTLSHHTQLGSYVGTSDGRGSALVGESKPPQSATALAGGKVTVRAAGSRRQKLLVSPLF